MPLIIQSKTEETFFLPKKPVRIVSLVPSQTELLYDLGLEKEVVGITKFCIHPTEWFKNKERVGGTKTVNIEKVKALKPDLILANKEENVKEQLEELSDVATVWTSDICNLNEALSMIETIGILTSKTTKAREIINIIETTFAAIAIPNKKIKATYLIWRDPYMAAGGDTFIHNMMSRCGLENVFEKEMRYPIVSFAEYNKKNVEKKDEHLSIILPVGVCELILLSSEPYPFAQKHIDEIQTFFPKAIIMLADGEMFSWYGSRLKYAGEYFNQFVKKLNNQS